MDSHRAPEKTQARKYNILVETWTGDPGRTDTLCKHAETGLVKPEPTYI